MNYLFIYHTVNGLVFSNLLYFKIKRLYDICTTEHNKRTRKNKPTAGSPTCVKFELTVVDLSTIWIIIIHQQYFSYHDWWN